jgi:proline dehydrogenase
MTEIVHPPETATPQPPEPEHPTLRAFFIYLSHARWARGIITHFPVARAMASRFFAGTTMDEAIAAIRALNAKGINATLDHLGESVSTEAEATRAADDYIAVLEHIQQAGVRANVSLKLTQMGLDLSSEFCTANVRRIVQRAQALGNFVRVDMEGSPHTDRTLAVFRTLRAEFDNVGLVLQAYLFRTEQDLVQLIDEGTRLRLCKGAYQEPASISFARKADTDANFVHLAQMMLDRAMRLSPASADGRFPPLPAIATHDDNMIAAARAYAEQIHLPREYLEFQMLYGIRRDLQEQLAAEGFQVRVYVPYGTQWYPYYMRRLAERPENVWFFIKNYFKR